MHPFDILSLDNGARLIFTPCPGTKGEPLTDVMNSLKAAGADAVVTMMPETELLKHQVEALPDICISTGMRWFHLPVEDSCAPEAPFEAKFATQKESLLTLLRSGATLVIHCHGGSGRTGLMAAILMLELGYAPALVKTQIQTLRPKSLTSPVQVNYLVEHYSFA